MPMVQAGAADIQHGRGSVQNVVRHKLCTSCVSLAKVIRQIFIRLICIGDRPPPPEQPHVRYQQRGRDPRYGCTAIRQSDDGVFHAVNGRRARGRRR